jgi:hypothetical protein
MNTLPSPKVNNEEVNGNLGDLDGGDYYSSLRTRNQSRLTTYWPGASRKQFKRVVRSFEEIISQSYLLSDNLT